MTQQLVTALVPEWTLGDRLRKARELAGLQAVQLAEDLGINRNSVANYESGRTSPRRPVLQAWSLRTGVSLEWLQTGESPRPAGGPNGGLEECAIRDSNPEPADSARNRGQRHPSRRNFVVPLALPRQRTAHRSSVAVGQAAHLGARPTRPAGAFPHPRHSAEQAAA